MRLLMILISLWCFAAVATAQTAPSSSDIARYDGLHLAAHTGDAAVIRQLASAGAYLEARDSNRRTPVHVAAFGAQHDALRALAAAGADMNALDGGLYDAVTIAAVVNDPETMSLALELGNRPDLTTSIYDGTALIAAAHLGHHEVVRRLIAAGAPLDHINNLRWTALMEAVVLGDGGPDHIATVEALVNAGADQSIPDRLGLTPLDHARQRGYGEIIKLLTE